MPRVPTCRRCPTHPISNKFNPGGAPVMVLAMSAETLTAGAVYDAADSIVAPRIARIPGVAAVQIQGAEQPAIRVTIDPAAAHAAGVGLEAVRQAIAENNVTQATGLVDGATQFASVSVNDRLATPEDYGRIMVKRQGDAIVRIASIGRVDVDARDRRQGGTVDGRQAVTLTVYKQADANVIEVADGIREILPQLSRWLPGGVVVDTIRDRSETIRASVHDVQQTLMVSIALVILVVAIFVRRLSAVVATGGAVPLSLLGTLAVMWLAGFSLNNLTLMALDHLGRLRGRRRHRHDRDHRRAARPRDAAAASGAAGRAADRLHRGLHHRLAHRRLHPTAVHGWRAGSHVPRILRDAGDRRRAVRPRLAHRHADAGGAYGAPRAAAAEPAGPGDRAGHGGADPRLCPQLAARAALAAVDAAGDVSG